MKNCHRRDRECVRQFQTKVKKYPKTIREYYNWFIWYLHLTTFQNAMKCKTDFVLLIAKERVKNYLSVADVLLKKC